jgi:predicted PurR-regulated permease PerM
VSKGIIYGFFGAAVAQGLLAGLGFYLAGISNAAFWGTMMAFFSPIPYIGTSLIWIPAVIILLVQKQFLAALFLFLWSAAIVGMADNIVKPYVIGRTTSVHPLAMLLVLLGGVIGFGLKGLILGPFLLTLLIGFLHIYRLEYKKVLGK